jgi:hypothetical protein
MANIEDGYAFVAPGTPEVAQALLDAAEQAGEDVHAVRTTIGGFYVPVSVSKVYEASLGADVESTVEYAEEAPEAPAEKSDFPDDSWKNADIEAYAADNGIDLGGATKKADMLAAIQSADKEE